MLSPVSSGMGDSLGKGKPSRDVTGHPGQISLDAIIIGDD